MYNDSNRLQEMDEIVKKTIISIDKGKKEIFEIGEDARLECRELEISLKELNDEINSTIEKIEHLEKLEYQSKHRLMTISKNFETYNEEDIRKAYDATKELQVQLIVQKKHEEQLKAKRSDIEHHIRRARSTLERAEYITSHVSSAMNYLQIALTNIDDTRLEIQKKEELGIRVIMAQEEERQRVARDIHDGPAQSLSNLSLKTELCEKLIDRDPERVRTELRLLNKLTRSSLQEIRKIIFDLRPMSLDDLGLIATLNEYISRFTNETGIDIIFEGYPEHLKVDPFVEVAVFRIIQEALNNVAKHSQATLVYVTLKIMEDILIGSVVDNGHGFKIENHMPKARPDNPNHGFGIYSMKQRAELLNGRITIKSYIGEGTTLRMEIPINPSGKESISHG